MFEQTASNIAAIEHNDFIARRLRSHGSTRFHSRLTTITGVPLVLWHDGYHVDFSALTQAQIHAGGLSFTLSRPQIDPMDFFSSPVAVHLEVQRPVDAFLLREYAADLNLPFDSANPLASLDEQGRLMRYLLKNGHDAIVCKAPSSSNPSSSCVRHVVFDHRQIVTIESEKIESALRAIKKAPKPVLRVRNKA